LTEGPPAEIKVGTSGIVGFAVAVGTEVKADDTLIKLGGYQRYEAKLGDGKTGGLLWDIEKRVPRELEKYKAQATSAREAGNEALAKQVERKLDERTARLEQKKRDRDATLEILAKFMVKAPTGGTVKTVVAPGKRVKEGDVVVRLEGAKALTATFPAGDQPYTAGAPVKVASKAAPEQKADCTVAEVKGSDVVVSCPADGAVAAGTEVVLE
jgi:biotin carboxyl carrier protein